MKNRKEKTENGWGCFFRRLIWLLLIPLGLLLPKLASQFPWIVEKYYSSLAYPYISGAVGFITSKLPFSLMEFLIILTVMALISYIVWLLVRLITLRLPIKGLLNRLLSLCIAGAVLLNVFYVLWGFNYFRPQLCELMNLNVQERSTAELETLCLRLSSEASELRAQVAEDETGVFAVAESTADMFNKLPAAYSAMGRENALFSQTTYPAKQILLSRGLSFTGIAGIYFPFTAEPNVNIDQPPLLRLSSAAHEMAHYLGFAHEDEANFLGYLACVYSDDPSIRYSGVMLALIESGNRLHDADSDRYFELLNTYSDGMLRDIRNYNAYWDGFEGELQETANQINDSYLKFNQQEEGVKSYGMMVDLLLAFYE